MVPTQNWTQKGVGLPGHAFVPNICVIVRWNGVIDSIVSMMNNNLFLEIIVIKYPSNPVFFRNIVSLQLLLYICKGNFYIT